MVKQKRLIFELRDLKAVRFRCKNCGGEVTIDPAGQHRTMPSKCPLCGQSWEQDAHETRLLWNQLQATINKESSAALVLEIDLEEAGGEE